jgi:UDP-2-acetamido-2,6-beta-L-arabino-hexul-4-ose reductase
MIDGVQVLKLDIKRDDRGWLAEILRESQNRAGSGIKQLYVTVGNAGKTRGKHYHRRKTEWFCVVSGTGQLLLKDTRTGEEATIPMGGNHMVTVCIPPHVAHAITNSGKDPLFLMVMVSEEFDPADPDTIPLNFAGL